MNQKIISIEITPNSDSVLTENGGVMWEHNATALKFIIDPELVGDYRYYIEYRSLMGTRVRTEYLELNAEDNTVTYNIPVSMSSLKAVEGYFNVVSIDEDGNTVQVIKPKKFQMTFDYSPDTDNSLCKVNDFSINSLLEAIRLGTFKGDKGDKGDTGEKGEKGDTGGISEEYATKNFANSVKGSAKGSSIILEDASPVEHVMDIRISSKNLFDVSKITASESSAEHISEVGADYLIVTTPDGYTSNGYCGTQVTLKEFCPQLEIGKIYTLNAETESAIKCIYLAAAAHSWNFGNQLTITESMLNSKVVFYGLSAKNGQGTGDCKISSIQIEEGEASTEYTPYIDPSAVILSVENGTTGEITEYAPNADGTVENVLSASPDMTIFTDAEGAIVSVEYNRDLQKIIESLINAVISLGGTI